jgi:hypothetical protein
LSNRAFEIVSLGDQVGVEGGHSLHKGGDIGHDTVDLWAHKTRWGGHRAALCSDVRQNHPGNAVW